MKAAMVKRWLTELSERRRCRDGPPLLGTPAAARRSRTWISAATSAAVSRLRSAATAAALLPCDGRRNRPGRTGSHAAITGTLYGHRRGHVHLAFQVDPSTPSPLVLLDLPIRTAHLAREMASGLVRIALECERGAKEPSGLLEERTWRAYCNGKRCGHAARRECGPGDRKVLEAVGPASMGAGVLPEGETMYMRARFERVVGSGDSQAFYMMNPDSKNGTELSIYFLRV